MSGIQAAERQTYTDMWALDAYATHSPGAAMVPIFLDMIRPLQTERVDQWTAGSVLDAGCGSGKGAIALRDAGFGRVTLCDLTDAGLVDEAKDLPFHDVFLTDNLAPAVGYHDWVYCCDVMEHVPPTFTMLVVHQMLRVARRGVFLSISLVPDGFGAWVGKPLHQSVQSFTAWRDQLATIGEVVECRDLLTSGVYLVRAR